MVRVSLMAILISVGLGAEAQTLSFGFRLGSGVASSIKLGEPRDYYLPDRYIRTSGKGMVETDAFMPPEIFFRYQSKNRLFIQAATAFVASLQTTFYGYDPEVEAQESPNGRWGKETFWGFVPADHQGARVLYFMPNVTVNYFLTKGTVLKPFIGLGFSPSIMQSNRLMSAPDPDEIDPTEAILYKDFGPRNNMVLNGKAVAGIQYYGLHAEASVYSNLTPIGSGNAYHKRVSTVYVAVGYNLLNFILTKKSRQ